MFWEISNMLSEIDRKKFWIYFVLFIVSLFLIISTGIFLSLENLNKILFLGFEASSSTSAFYLNFSNLIRSGIAFSAGLVAVFNPCGFALLSVYLSSFLRKDEKPLYMNSSSVISRKILEPIYISTIVTIGFIIVFFIFGSIISAGFYSIRSIFSYFGLLISILLLGYGFFILYGGNIYFSKLQKLAYFFDSEKSGTSRFYFVYGISYGITSLSCTLPIFMSVVFSLTNVSEIQILLKDFILFSVGTWFALITVSFGLLFLKLVVDKVKVFLIIYKYITSAVLILSSAYLIFYWMSEFKI